MRINRGETRLITAVRQGNIEHVTSLLKLRSVKINQQDTENGFSALHAGINEMDFADNPRDIYKCVLALLRHPKINVNLRSNISHTPLIMATTFSPKPEIFAVFLKLLKHPKTKVNAQNRSGFTALIVAAQVCHFENLSYLRCIENLVKHPKINVSYQTQYFEDALSLASRNCPTSENSRKAVEAIVSHPTVCFYETLKRTAFSFSLSFERNHAKEAYFINLVSQHIRKESTNCLSIPRLSLLNDPFEVKLVEEIVHSRRLTSLSTPDGIGCVFRDRIHKNFSITQWSGPKTIHEEFKEKFLERNSKALAKCRAATLYTILAFRTNLHKDMAVMLGKMVWDTRGTKVWADIHLKIKCR